jgi:hypothetical protein
VLGIAHASNADEIKRAHRRLARLYHPDNAATGNDEKFKEVQAAFELLRDSNWTAPGPSPENASARAAGMYDTPGSTQDNYVHGNTRLQTLLRIAVAWCLFFFTARMMLNAMFPPRKMQAILDDMEQHRRIAAAESEPILDSQNENVAASGASARSQVDADPLARS